MMKIMHFCDTISIGGGIASFVNNLSIEQAQQHNVTIGVICSNPNEKRLLFPSNIQIVEFNKMFPGFSIKYPLKIFNYLLKNRYDVIHIHSSFLYYFLPILFLHRRIKFIYTVHSDAVKENHSKWDKRFWKLKKWCFRNNLIVPVTISPNSKKSFDDLYKMDSAMVINGIRAAQRNSQASSLECYRLTQATKVLLHVGRITEAKNQVILCEAVSLLIKEGYDIALVIVGVVQDEQIFQQISAFFNERIHFIGERNDVIDLLSDADAMCLSSIWEGLPIILLESLSVGCIPICTSVGGIPNVILDSENGVLADSTNVSDYKKAIIRFLSLNDSELSEMRAKAIDTFSNYDIKITSSRYHELYVSK